MTYNPTARGIPSLARAASRLLANNTGNTVAKATPVRLSATGLLPIDVSNESQANAIAGLTKIDITNLSIGEVVSSGILENISTSAGIGDIMYVSKSGDLTNIKPSIGVNSFVTGDWVIRVGAIAKNNDNPVQKDILVNIQIVGEL